MVDPFTATYTAIAVLQAVSELNRGPDGLGANMVAINGKLDIAIRQLAAIQKAIEFLIVEIADLKKEILAAIGEQYAYELQNEITADIEAFQDIVREANFKGVSLAADNPNRGDFPGRLYLAYNNFDRSRRKLRKLPEGRGPISSSICSACAAVDCAAFACGTIDEPGISISLQHHLDWLDSMLKLEENDQYSIAARLQEYLQAEEKIVAEAKSSSPVDPAYIAYKLYYSSPVDLCVVYRMDVQLFDEHREWSSFGVTKSVLVATFSRSEINESGASFLEDIRVENSVAHYLPDGQLWPIGPGQAKAEMNDGSKCLTRDLSAFRMPIEVQGQKGVLYSFPSDPRVWKKIAASVFDHVRASGPEWRAWGDSSNGAQAIFDNINLQRLKQVYARQCGEIVLAHRVDVQKLLQSFPPVPVIAGDDT